MKISLLVLILGFILFACTTPQKEKAKDPVEKKIATIEDVTKPEEPVKKSVKKSVKKKFNHTKVFYFIDHRTFQCFAVHPQYGMASVDCNDENVDALLINKKH